MPASEWQPTKQIDRRQRRGAAGTGEMKQAAAELDAMIGRARTYPGPAWQVLAVLTVGSRTLASFYRERQFFASLGIPAQLLPDHGALRRTDLRL
jgi:hypothetical protein